MKITKFRVNGQDAIVSETALEGQLLPPPSAEDAGKTVVVGENGKYELAEPGGSNAPLICTDTDGTLDKTMGEIQTVYFSGKPVFVDGSLVVLVAPVSEGRAGFDAHLELGTIMGNIDVYRNISYWVTGEATESAALAAYPTIGG